MQFDKFVIQLGEIAAISQQHLRSKGIDLHLRTAVTGFERNGNELKVLLKDEEHLEGDVVILSIGVKPDTKLATDAGLQLGCS